jgi:hypothetical protein
MPDIKANAAGERSVPVCRNGEAALSEVGASPRIQHSTARSQRWFFAGPLVIQGSLDEMMLLNLFCKVADYSS